MNLQTIGQNLIVGKVLCVTEYAESGNVEQLFGAVAVQVDHATYCLVHHAFCSLFVHVFQAFLPLGRLLLSPLMHINGDLGTQYPKRSSLPVSFEYVKARHRYIIEVQNMACIVTMKNNREPQCRSSQDPIATSTWRSFRNAERLRGRGNS